MRSKRQRQTETIILDGKNGLGADARFLVRLSFRLSSRAVLVVILFSCAGAPEQRFGAIPSGDCCYNVYGLSITIRDNRNSCACGVYLT
jgi:hypothetical protein